MSITKVSVYSIALLIVSKLAFAAQLNVGSFNINSSKAAPHVIAQQIVEHENIDIWGLAESSDEWSGKAWDMLNSNHKNVAIIKGTSGFDRSRLQILYNTDKFQLISSTELDDINVNGIVRAPLVARFKDLETNQQFIFMVNHLYRKKNDERTNQARKINLWTRQQSLPVIAVGDYNFDLSPNDISQHGAGYDEIVRDHVFTWIQPKVLFPTQCSHFNSILDFVFISDKLNYTSATSNISYTDFSYCNPSNNFSDHRPVTATIDWG